MCILLEEVSHYLYILSVNHLSSLYTAAPVIDTPSSSNVTITVGSSLTLNCSSQGSPPDIFTWRKDNSSTVIQSTSITVVDYTSTSAVFSADYVIDSVTASDSGTYTCTVTNPIGSDNATTIAVIGILSSLYSVLLQTYYLYKPLNDHNQRCKQLLVKCEITGF